MKKLFLLGIMLLAIPAAFSFDCSFFSGQNKTDCLHLNSTNESLIADLIYTSHTIPDHKYISQYNAKIQVKTPPNDTKPQSSGVIKNGWFTFTTIEPSVLYQSTLYVNSSTVVSTASNYQIQLPTTYTTSKKETGTVCRKEYRLISQNAQRATIADGKVISKQAKFTINISKPTRLEGRYTITANVEEIIYRWESIDDSLKCRLDDKNTITYTLTVNDSATLIPYKYLPAPQFIFLSNNAGTYTGVINGSGNFLINFSHASYEQQNFRYRGIFIKQPYNLLKLVAYDIHDQTTKNLYTDNKIIYVYNPQSCAIITYDFFGQGTSSCSYNITNSTVPPFTQSTFSNNWRLTLLIGLFSAVCYCIYLVLKHTWGKRIGLFLLPLIAIPAARAEECGLTNLASCIPEKTYDFFISILNSPLQPLLDAIRGLLASAPQVEVMTSLWGVMVYVISLFYGLLFMYAGFQFLFSGHDVIRREMAKEWLKNTVIMIVLVQGSLYLYKLILEVGAVLSSAVLSMVPTSFFQLSVDNLTNVGLEFFFGLFYVVALLGTLLMLTIRYLIIVMGAIILPLGIFCYYIPPLKSYGQLIVHTLLMFVFIGFLNAVIILACSKVLETSAFANIKILVMIGCFTIVNLSYLVLLWHILSKSGAVQAFGGIAGAAKYFI